MLRCYRSSVFALGGRRVTVSTLQHIQHQADTAHRKDSNFGPLRVKYVFPVAEPLIRRCSFTRKPITEKLGDTAIGPCGRFSLNSNNLYALTAWSDTANSKISDRQACANSASSSDSHPPTSVTPGGKVMDVPLAPGPTTITSTQSSNSISIISLNRQEVSDITVAPLTTLKNFLSPYRHQPLTFDTLDLDVNGTTFPGPRGIETLCTSYRLVKRDSQLRFLTPKELTDLARLYGSISLRQTRAKYTNLSKSTSHLLLEWCTVDPYYYPFIVEIAQDKEALGYSLNHTDNFWVLRALLAIPATPSREDSLSVDRRRLHALSKATHHYLRICNSPNPNIHIPYFEALLSSNRLEYIDVLVQRLCHYLEVHRSPAPRLLELLWELVLYRQPLNAELRSRLLSMIATRLRKFSSYIQHLPSRGDSSSRDIKRPYLHTELALAIFSAHSNVALMAVRSWAIGQAKIAFSQELTVEDRWTNFLLLAMANKSKPRTSATGTASFGSPRDSSQNATDWRTILALVTLERTFEGAAPLVSQFEIQNVTRGLWKAWKGSMSVGLGSCRPRSVSRAILIAFLRLAAKSKDAPLKEACFRFCTACGLWGDWEQSSGQLERSEAKHLAMAYVLASMACHEAYPIILAKLDSVICGDEGRRAGLFEALIRYCVQRGDGRSGHALFILAEAKQIKFGTDVIHFMGKRLASRRTLDLVVPLLQDARLGRHQVQDILYAILDSLRIERAAYLDPALAARIGERLLGLYKEISPPSYFKYPFRYFLPLLVSSGHPDVAVSLMRYIHKRSPSFFSTRFFLRVMRSLLRHRHFRYLPNVMALTSSPSVSSLNLTPPLDDLRRKLVQGLSRGGAHQLARSVYSQYRFRRTTARDLISHTVGFQTGKPSPHVLPRVLALLSRKPSRPTDIRSAILVLSHARRPLAVMKLLGRESVQLELDAKTKTAVCNIALHGLVLGKSRLNARLVRHVLRTKDLLVERYGFAPDRVTINILLKAILLWHTGVNPPRLKALFNHLIGRGYSIPVSWQRHDGLPFVAPTDSLPTLFRLPDVPPPGSFERHVRPLFKMFIKAFYGRHDVRAAKTVVGILKDAEAEYMQRREERERARRLGLVKKRRKEMLMQKQEGGKCLRDE